MDVSQPMNAEAVEMPNIIAQQSIPALESPVPPEVSLPAEPSVSDISSAVPSAESSKILPPTSEASLLGSEIPQIAPAEVNSILSEHEEPQVPPTPAQQEEAAATAVQPSDMPQMENMGYDQVSPKRLSCDRTHIENILS